MITTDFAYYRPANLLELTQATDMLKEKEFFYYAGGSEIISMSRAGTIAPDALIDIKDIAQVNEISMDNGVLTIGAAVTLARIAEYGGFPLLSATASRVADHTNQCRITLGGNVAGSIIYRECALPLMLTDATVTFFRNGKTRVAPINEAFDRKLMCARDELMLSFQIDKKYLSLPWTHAKRTRGEKIDYPIVTIAAMKVKEELRFALSGVLGYPFRGNTFEGVFSDSSKPAKLRAKQIVSSLQEPILSDIIANSDWRAFQTEIVLENAITRLEGCAK